MGFHVSTGLKSGTCESDYKSCLGATTVNGKFYSLNDPTDKDKHDAQCTSNLALCCFRAPKEKFCKKNKSLYHSSAQKGKK